MTEQPDIIGAAQALTDGPILSTYQRKMDAILLHFQRGGLTLEQCADPRRMGRSLATLKRYVRRLGVAFPDYTPMALRPKVEKAEKRRRPRK